MDATTLSAVRWNHPAWTIRRSACPWGCCQRFEACRIEGTGIRVCICFTLTELDLRLNHYDKPHLSKETG